VADRKKQVRFALSRSQDNHLLSPARITSERALETVNLGIWLGLAAPLWLLIVLAFI
jgi:hypothetical protein